VEDSNRRARSLYERLGYAVYGRRPGAWDEEAADGSLRRYETMLTLLGKDLPLAAQTSAGPDLSRTGRKPPSEQE
jgi:ribosomal protein S18 acetylase RimI-like enzyme